MSDQDPSKPSVSTSTVPLKKETVRISLRAQSDESGPVAPKGSTAPIPSGGPTTASIAGIPATGPIPPAASTDPIDATAPLPTGGPTTAPIGGASRPLPPTSPNAPPLRGQVLQPPRRSLPLRHLRATGTICPGTSPCAFRIDHDWGKDDSALEGPRSDGTNETSSNRSRCSRSSGANSTCADRFHFRSGCRATVSRWCQNDPSCESSWRWWPRSSWDAYHPLQPGGGGAKPAAPGDRENGANPTDGIYRHADQKYP